MKGQIIQLRCRPQNGAYLGLFASKHSVSFERLEGLEAWT